MNRSYLIGMVVILGALLLITQPEKPSKSLRDTRILKVDPQQIHSISIGSTSKEEVALEKRDDSWVVGNLKGFGADAKKITQMLQDLFMLKYGVIVQKDGGDLASYGLEAESSQNTSISLKDSSGTVLSSLVLGNSRLSKGQYGFDVPSGQYIRVKDEQSVYLLKDQQSISKDPDQWIHKKLPVIASEDVQKILVRPGQVDGFELMRLKKEDELQLSNLTDEEKVKATEVQSLQEILKDFSFSKLVSKDSEEAVKSLTRTEEFQLMTFQGLVFNAKVGVKLDATSMRYLELTWSGISPDDQTGALIKELNERYADWVLGISDFQAKKFLKSRTELVESKPLGAKHILISYDGANNSKSKLTKAEARELAQNLIGKLANGVEFAALAKEFSTDDSNKDKGGDLGSFGRGAMVKPFEDATLALKVGERTQEPVETVYGFHVIERTQ